LASVLRGVPILCTFLRTPDGASLRAVSTQLEASVAACAWDDADTLIAGSLVGWRASFPHAVAANICNRRDLRKADFVLLRGIKRLNMYGCTGVTDAALAHVASTLEELNIVGCTGLTNAVAAHLTQVQDLTVYNCGPGITGALLASLPSLRRLTTFGHGALPFSLASLRGSATLEYVDISGSTQLVDDALSYIAGVPEVVLNECFNITDAGIAHLRGARRLSLVDCSPLGDAALAHLRGVEVLNLCGCYRVTDAGLAHIAGAHELNISDIPNITDAGLRHIVGVRKLTMHYYYGDGITTAGIRALREGGLTELDITDSSESLLAAVKSAYGLTF
jgi:hypothetical protein